MKKFEGTEKELVGIIFGDQPVRKKIETFIARENLENAGIEYEDISNNLKTAEDGFIVVNMKNGPLFIPYEDSYHDYLYVSMARSMNETDAEELEKYVARKEKDLENKKFLIETQKLRRVFKGNGN